MNHINRLTLMIIDNNRFFLDGVLAFIESQYPDVTIRLSGRKVKQIDVLMVGLDRVSLSTARCYSHRLAARSRVLMIHDDCNARQSSIPFSLRQHNLIHMHRKQTLSEFSAIISKILGSVTGNGSRTILTIIDKKSANISILTPQEKVLVDHMRVNTQLKEIACQMALNPKTISTYKRSIMQKLDMQKNLEFYHWLLYSNN